MLDASQGRAQRIDEATPGVDGARERVDCGRQGLLAVRQCGYSHVRRRRGGRSADDEVGLLSAQGLQQRKGGIAGPLQQVEVAWISRVHRSASILRRSRSKASRCACLALGGELHSNAMALFRVTAGGVYLARSAVVTSEVLIGAQSSLWFNVVVRGDVAPISIGRRVNVQDNCVVHCDFGKPLVIEDDVSIGHSAVVHGLLVGAGSLVGMHATLLGGTRVGRGCLVAAGAVVPPA